MTILESRFAWSESTWTSPSASALKKRCKSPNYLPESTIDALSSHICVLDEAGAIVSVNRAVRNFAEANRFSTHGGVDGSKPGKGGDCFEGVDYLAVCDRGNAVEVADAIRAILRGEREQFFPNTRVILTGRSDGSCAASLVSLVVLLEDRG